LKLYPESAEAVLRTVRGGAAEGWGAEGNVSAAADLFAGKGLEKGSERYALGRWAIRRRVGCFRRRMIGFDKAAEVVTAKYEGKGTLTMLLYPTPQIAGDHGRQIEAEMNREGSSAGDGEAEA